MSGRADGKQGLMMSLGKESATEALQDLEINLDSDQAHDLSDIRMDN